MIDECAFCKKEMPTENLYYLHPTSCVDGDDLDDEIPIICGICYFQKVKPRIMLMTKED